VKVLVEANRGITDLEKPLPEGAFLLLVPCGMEDWTMLRSLNAKTARLADVDTMVTKFLKHYNLFKGNSEICALFDWEEYHLVIRLRIMSAAGFLNAADDDPDFGAVCGLLERLILVPFAPFHVKKNALTAAAAITFVPVLQFAMSVVRVREVSVTRRDYTATQPGGVVCGLAPRKRGTGDALHAGAELALGGIVEEEDDDDAAAERAATEDPDTLGDVLHVMRHGSSAGDGSGGGNGSGAGGGAGASAQPPGGAEGPGRDSAALLPPPPLPLPLHATAAFLVGEDNALRAEARLRELVAPLTSDITSLKYTRMEHFARVLRVAWMDKYPEVVLKALQARCRKIVHSGHPKVPLPALVMPAKLNAQTDRFAALFRPNPEATSWTVEEAAYELLHVEEPQLVMAYQNFALMDLPLEAYARHKCGNYAGFVALVPHILALFAATKHPNMVNWLIMGLNDLLLWSVDRKDILVALTRGATALTDFLSERMNAALAASVSANTRIDLGLQVIIKHSMLLDQERDVLNRVGEGGRHGKSLERLLGGNNAALTKDELKAVENLKGFVSEFFVDVRAGKVSFGAPYNVLAAGYNDLLLKRRTRQVGFNKKTRTPTYERSWVTKATDWMDSMAKPLARLPAERREGEEDSSRGSGDSEMEDAAGDEEYLEEE
jgi:hypothetical protein